MPRIVPALAAAVLVLCTACGTAFDRPRPATVSHLDIVRKQEYISTTKATLKTFRATARDLRSRNRPVSLRELAGRFDRYMAVQVRPIVGDFEAQNTQTVPNSPMKGAVEPVVARKVRNFSRRWVSTVVARRRGGNTYARAGRCENRPDRCGKGRRRR